MSHSRYKPTYGLKHSSILSIQNGMTMVVAQPVAAQLGPDKSAAQASADPHRQDSKTSSRDAQEAMTAEMAVSHWWYFPAVVAVSAISIALAVYLVSISQFGTDMLFMFRNLI